MAPPAHIGHGSIVTYRVHPVNRQRWKLLQTLRMTNLGVSCCIMIPVHGGYDDDCRWTNSANRISPGIRFFLPSSMAGSHKVFVICARHCIKFVESVRSFVIIAPLNILHKSIIFYRVLRIDLIVVSVVACVRYDLFGIWWRWWYHHSPSGTHLWVCPVNGYFGMAVLALLPLLGAVIRDVLLGYFPLIRFVNYGTVVLAVTPYRICHLYQSLSSQHNGMTSW